MSRPRELCLAILRWPPCGQVLPLPFNSLPARLRYPSRQSWAGPAGIGNSGRRLLEQTATRDSKKLSAATKYPTGIFLSPLQFSWDFWSRIARPRPPRFSHQAARRPRRGISEESEPAGPRPPRFSAGPRPPRRPAAAAAVLPRQPPLGFPFSYLFQPF